MRSTAWLVLPLLAIAPIYACAQGTPTDNVIPGNPQDGSVGGAGGEQGGSAGQAGGAGTQSNGGSQNQGGSAGTAGTAGTAEGGAAGAGGVAGGGGSSGGATGGTAGSGTGGGGTGGNNCTPPVPNAPCDTFPQCGCKAGESCDVNNAQTGMTQCGPSDNIPKGTVCQYNNSCAPGLSCVGLTCKPFCEKATDCSTSGADCIGVQYTQTDGGSGDVPAMKVCTDQCDPITSQGCGAGAGCFPIDDLNVKPGHSLCAKAGTSTTTCSPTVDCAPSYVCLSDNQCHKWCRSTVPTDCTGGQTCYQFQDNSTPPVVGFYYVGTQGFGVCG